MHVARIGDKKKYTENFGQKTSRDEVTLKLQAQITRQ